MYQKLVPLKIEATIKYPEDIVTGFKFAKKIFATKEYACNAITEGLYMNEVIVFHDQEVVLERWADYPHFCLYPDQIKKIPNYQDWEFHFETNYVRKQYVQVDKILEYCIICDNKQILKRGQKYILEFKNQLYILDRCSLELIEKVINTVVQDIQYTQFEYDSLNTDVELETDVVKGLVCFGVEGELVIEYFKIFAPEVHYS
jgi:hypothetical protein